MAIIGYEPAMPVIETKDSSVSIGLTIRQKFAMSANPDIDGFNYKDAVMSEMTGLPIPTSGEYIKRIKFNAAFKACMKVIEADALIAELNK